MDLWNEYRAIVQLLASSAVLIAAFRYGANPERWLGTALFAMLVLTHVYASVRSRNLVDIDLVTLTIELALATVLIVIALKANRMYPLWIAGLQIIALMAHFARGSVEEISPLAYLVMFVAPSYFQIAILACGVWLHHRRVQLHGNYRSWRSSSLPSPETTRRN